MLLLRDVCRHCQSIVLDNSYLHYIGFGFVEVFAVWCQRQRIIASANEKIAVKLKSIEYRI